MWFTWLDDPRSDCCGFKRFKYIRETTEPTLDEAITMAQQTKAVREQEAVVRGETDNTCTRIEAVEHGYSNKKLWTMFQVSKIPKQPTRKVAPDVAIFLHI